MLTALFLQDGPSFSHAFDFQTLMTKQTIWLRHMSRVRGSNVGLGCHRKDVDFFYC
jgi:hypothetical protein